MAALGPRPENSLPVDQRWELVKTKRMTTPSLITQVVTTCFFSKQLAREPETWRNYADLSRGSNNVRHH